MAQRIDTLILERCDLTIEAQYLPFNQITYSSLKGGIRILMKEDLAFFMDTDGRMKALKNRRGPIENYG